MPQCTLPPLLAPHMSHEFQCATREKRTTLAGLSLALDIIDVPRPVQLHRRGRHMERRDRNSANRRRCSHGVTYAVQRLARRGDYRL